MKNRIFKIIIFAAVLLWPAGILAAPAPKPVGITVSPAYQQVSVAPGEAQHPVQFKITNNESASQTLDLAVRDFNTLGESGGLFFVGTNPTQLQKKYGLAEWFRLSSDTVTLAPGQTQTIQGAILNTPELSPGGHYGALLLTAHQPDSNQSSSKITLRPVASSLMFVTKIGGDTHSLNLAGVNYMRSLFSMPSSVALRLKNDGNTHVVPRGLVTITDSSGKLVSKGIINQDSNIILPQTYRQIYVPLTSVSGARSVGRYQLKVDFRFDGISQYREYRTSFDYFPKALIIALILAVMAAIIILARRRPKHAKK